MGTMTGVLATHPHCLCFPRNIFCGWLVGGKGQTLCGVLAPQVQNILSKGMTGRLVTLPLREHQVEARAEL